MYVSGHAGFGDASALAPPPSCGYFQNNQNNACVNASGMDLVWKVFALPVEGLSKLGLNVQDSMGISGLAISAGAWGLLAYLILKKRSR